jgi:hypothetical protein
VANIKRNWYATISWLGFAKLDSKAFRGRLIGDENEMHAIVRTARIDIEGASGVAKDSWEPLLDELKAIHMPGLTPTGKRLMVAVNPSGRVDAFIYRTGMPDEAVVRILQKHGIDAYTEADLAKMQRK